MLELEIKLPLRPGGAKADLTEQLTALGFRKEAEILETDVYLDNAGRQIRLGGSALRVRRVRDVKTGTEHACVTFKGPKMDTVSMSRQELETGVQDADTMLAVLAALGYLPVEPSVRKNRCSFCRGRMNACLDEVEGLGLFLELEIVADEPAQAQNREAIRREALSEIELVLQQLGYTLADTVTNSYLSMLQHQAD